MSGFRTLIYLLGIALLVWIVVRRGKERLAQKRPAIKTGDMVQCAHCGTYVPLGEAVREGERYYCCDDHRTGDR